MAYRVIYASDSREKKGARSGSFILMTVFFFILFLGAVFQFWPEGQLALQTWLLPWNSRRTLEAVEVFSQELSCGFSLGDAVQNFWDAAFHAG